MISNDGKCISGEVLAIGLFVASVVVVIAGGGVMLFLILRRINGMLASNLLVFVNIKTIQCDRPLSPMYLVFWYGTEGSI